MEETELSQNQNESESGKDSIGPENTSEIKNLGGIEGEQVIVSLDENFEMNQDSTNRILAELTDLGYVHKHTSTISKILFGDKKGDIEELVNVKGVARVSRGGKKFSQ